MLISDPYFDRERCIQRLLEQYQKHKRLVVCCDFDDTLYDFHKKGYKFDKVIELLRSCQELGFHIVIFTSSHINRYPFIMDYCKSVGITPTKINEDAIITPFGEKSKLYYNIFLDDKCGLSEAYEILSATISRIKLLQ